MPPAHVTSLTYTWDKSVFTAKNCSCCRSESGGLRAGHTSGVPQKVEVVPLCSMFSLQSPKSVKTIWPCESSRMFSGFKSLQEEMKEINVS